MVAIIQQMNKDQSLKEELKVQVEELTTYIQQWTSTKEALTTSFAPKLLSQDELTKMEKMKNWTSVITD